MGSAGVDTSMSAIHLCWGSLSPVGMGAAPGLCPALLGELWAAQTWGLRLLAAAIPVPWQEEGAAGGAHCVTLVPCSPHPVKPLNAVQEGSSEKKQQPKTSLSSAFSNGLERLKTVTTSSVQPVAPASHPDKTEPKVKAGAWPEVRLCQSCSRCAAEGGGRAGSCHGCVDPSCHEPKGSAAPAPIVLPSATWL